MISAAKRKLAGAKSEGCKFVQSGTAHLLNIYTHGYGTNEAYLQIDSKVSGLFEV
jgi:hypothetical protein